MRSENFCMDEDLRSCDGSFSDMAYFVWRTETHTQYAIRHTTDGSLMKCVSPMDVKAYGKLQGKERKVTEIMNHAANHEMILYRTDGQSI
ncbi:hypothetical protein HYR99_18355 [Candidatus Poribacteria bacterium]|nr:hypothetical protein [Candidatus Poribacteria bacterium]